MSAGADQAARLEALLRADAGFLQALHAARGACAELGVADWAIGAGAVRNRVWDALWGTQQPAEDCDLLCFEPARTGPALEAALEAALRQRAPGLRWEAVNQAGVHRWYRPAIAPRRSLEEGVAGWPETATCVALRLEADGAFTLIAPLGLDDLFAGRLRANPACPDPAAFARRLASKRFLARWPALVLAD